MALVYRNSSLESWTPNFSSSGQANPTWIRVTCAGNELINALNRVAWTENPVQFQLCDACGYVDCSSGGYAHVTRVGDALLCTTPQLDDPDDDWAATQYAASYLIQKFGSIVIPGQEWHRWQSAAQGIPELSAIAPATGREIADAWRMSAPHPNRVHRLDEIQPLLRERLLGTDTMEPDMAIREVETLASWLNHARESVLRGELADPHAIGARCEKFYFDGPGEEDWFALALLETRCLIALGQDLVFVPEIGM